MRELANVLEHEADLFAALHLDAARHVFHLAVTLLHHNFDGACRFLRVARNACREVRLAGIGESKRWGAEEGAREGGCEMACHLRVSPA
jgi:hypothetical protein